MPEQLGSICESLLTELKIISSGQSLHVQPLTGGVASDIALVQVGDRKLCVKFALPKLKVEADWFAPVHRNAAEYAWLEVVSGVAPASAIKLLGRSPELHGFAMEFLDGDQTYLWKEALLNEAPDQSEAAKVGDLIGRIHAASTQTNFKNQAFQNRDDFRAIRIEPYLLYTATVHTDIAEKLNAVAAQLYETNQVLIHGDISPKNIFFRGSDPVILDAECATMGDASFDLSFCLNHLVLKAIHLPRVRKRYLANARQLWESYRQHIKWEQPLNLEMRVCRLLPILMLGRVDGKSPVEYLFDSERETVRIISRELVKTPVDQLDVLLTRITETLDA